MTVGDVRRQSAHKHLVRAWFHARDKQWEGAALYARKAARTMAHARWLGGDLYWGMRPMRPE